MCFEYGPFGLFYKNITIVNDTPRVIRSDGPSCGVTYDRHCDNSSGPYYKTITIVIDTPSVVKSDAPNCSITY